MPFLILTNTCFYFFLVVVACFCFCFSSFFFSFSPYFLFLFSFLAVSICQLFFLNRKLAQGMCFGCSVLVRRCVCYRSRKFAILPSFLNQYAHARCVCSNFIYSWGFLPPIMYPHKTWKIVLFITLTEGLWYLENLQPRSTVMIMTTMNMIAVLLIAAWVLRQVCSDSSVVESLRTQTWINTQSHMLTQTLLYFIFCLQTCVHTCVKAQTHTTYIQHVCKYTHTPVSYTHLTLPTTAEV